jgi:hypothetical protein
MELWRDDGLQRRSTLASIAEAITYMERHTDLLGMASTTKTTWR